MSASIWSPGTFPTLAAYAVDVTAYPYLADNTGVNDSYAAIQAAADAIPYGGFLFIPSGKYKLTDEVRLHAGITVFGAGAADFVFGSPPAYASEPSMLVQVTTNKAALRIGGGMHNINIFNLAFAPDVTPAYPAVETPAVDGRVGILLQSSTKVVAPIPDDNGHLWGLEFRNLTFYNYEYGIKVNDPNSGDTGSGDYPYDWSVAPALMSNLRFIYCKYGMYFNTSNADAWVNIGCHFQIPSGGSGVQLRRWGMMSFKNCFAGSNAVSSNKFFDIIDNGTVNGVEDLILDSCQCETLTQFLNVASNTSASYKYTITARDCVAELTSDIYLAAPVNFVSTRNRWTSQIYVAHIGVRIDSLFDYLPNPYKFQFLVGSLAECVQTLLPGNTSPDYADVTVLAGRINQYLDAVPVAGIYGTGDRIVRKTPTVGQPKAWVVTTSGGAVTGTRANTTLYAAGVWVTWSTGTTVWECTVSGTTAGAAPSIVGKVIGDTVVDGTVTWTMRANTTAAFTSEGNL